MKHRAVYGLALTSTIVSIAYSFLVLPGQPTDEPFHYKNVQYYSTHWRLPVLGQPGVTYEGQMGPVYYELTSAIYRVPWLSERGRFHAIRLIGSLLMFPFTVLAFRIAYRAVPDRPGWALVVALLAAFNPSILSIASSIQNDMLAIVLCMWATDLAAQWMDEGRPTAGHGAAIGVVVSAAILVKATALYIVFAVPVYAWLAGGRKTIKFSVVFGLTAALLAGWWFARNVILYGDLSAQKALTLYHYGNNPPPTPLWQLGPLKKWLWGIETYYWLPTEYHRNLYSAPLWARSIVGVITLAGIGGWLARPKTPASNASHRAKWFRWFLALQYLACFGLYAYTCMRITDFAARCTFPTYVVYATFICVGGIYLLGRALGPPRALSVYAIVLTLALVSLNGFVLLQACRDYAMPYDIPLSAAR